MTDDQLSTLKILRQRWPRVGEPEVLMGGDGCVMVACYSTEEAEEPYIFVGIEPDGYPHT